MSFDDTAWDAIRRAWTDTLERPRDIGLRFGISHQAICLKARRQKWPPRPATEQQPAACDEPPLAAVVSKRPTRARSAAVGGDLMQRLYAAVETIVAKIEDTMTTTDADTLIGTERLARTLGTLIRHAGKLQDVDDKKKRQGAGSAGKRASEADTQRRREELAERLVKLLRAQSDQDNSST